MIAGNDSTERTIRAAAGTMYIGGADTIGSSLSRFLLAMMANPDEAQTEVDAVTGRRYRPDFEDESSMPYVTALRRRVLRRQNVMPNGLNWLVDQHVRLLISLTYLALPHYVVVDDQYKGYRILAGSIVIGND
jgi:cytochrome P450